MKEEQKRTLTIAGIALAVIAVATFLFMRKDSDTGPPVVSSGIYYTGPMKSKNPGSNSYGTIDGNTMTPEEAKAAAEKWQQDNLKKN